MLYIYIYIDALGLNSKFIWHLAIWKFKIERNSFFQFAK